MRCCCLAIALTAVLWMGAMVPRVLSAQASEQPSTPVAGGKQLPKSPLGAPPGAIPLSKTDRVWIDTKRKAVFIDGTVVLRDGPPLEMLACPVGTKEHESIIAVHAQANLVHAGLLAVGAEVGHPVKLEPEYVPATGTRIDILLQWKDATGRRHHAPAQHWVRHIATQKTLEHPWVFAGSGFWTDEQSGERRYHGDSGDFICVSNFQTATLDLPVPSSQANADLLYEAFTEHIPPKGTAVRMVLLPRLHEMPNVNDKAEQQEKPPGE